MFLRLVLNLETQAIILLQPVQFFLEMVDSGGFVCLFVCFDSGLTILLKVVVNSYTQAVLLPPNPQ
jgi:hypothetical protein